MVEDGGRWRVEESGRGRGINMGGLAQKIFTRRKKRKEKKIETAREVFIILAKSSLALFSPGNDRVISMTMCNCCSPRGFKWAMRTRQ